MAGWMLELYATSKEELQLCGIWPSVANIPHNRYNNFIESLEWLRDNEFPSFG